jgi:hypothetical protein
MDQIVKYFRANPQVFILLLICVVLGLGTFLAVVISLASTTGKGEGYPNGTIWALQAVLG